MQGQIISQGFQTFDEICFVLSRVSFGNGDGEHKDFPGCLRIARFFFECKGGNPQVAQQGICLSWLFLQLGKSFVEMSYRTQVALFDEGDSCLGQLACCLHCLPILAGQARFQLFLEIGSSFFEIFQGEAIHSDIVQQLPGSLSLGTFFVLEYLQGARKVVLGGTRVVEKIITAPEELAAVCRAGARAIACCLES